MFPLLFASKFRLLFAILSFAATAAFPIARAASLNCIPAATPQIVHAEGITERTGDIVFVCSGGAPGATLTVDLFFFLNVDITNRLTSAGSNTFTGISLTADNGFGPQPIAAPATRVGPGTLTFNGATFTLSSTGTVTLRLTNLRGAANELDFDLTKAMQVLIGLNPSTVLSLPTNQLAVGRPEYGLYVGSSGELVCTQAGSPLPGNVASFASFVAAGSVSASTRVTEGFADAFGPKSDPQNLNADTGTRIVVQYSGFPPGARLFVPTVVAGSDATQATSGGNLGLPVSGGEYTPGPNPSLLLSFVSNTDANGAGGIPSYLPELPGSGTATFDSMSEVVLINGAGIAVYEVVDANPSLQESAQFPTFLALAPSGSGTSIQTSQNVSLGPISTVQTATATDPIPRFQQITPPEDCTLLGDCGAQYFPRLLLQTSSLSYTTQAGGNSQTQYFAIQNGSGGLLEWTISVKYLSGNGWLSLSASLGENNGDVRIDAVPGSLAPGTYQAILTVNAGPLAGSQDVPVTFVITPAAPPVPQPPTVQSVVNGATFASGPIAPGSIATLNGSQFSGQNVSVTFGGLPGQVLFSNATQINVVVPAGLANPYAEPTSTQVVVTVDGTASAPFTASLAPFAPGIFANGVLNQDNSLNSAKQPAAPGSIIQIFATGLSGSGAISATFDQASGSRGFLLKPYYGGPAPGLAGVQQVDLILATATLTGTTVNVSVCGGSTAAQTVCSPPVAVSVSQ